MRYDVDPREFLLTERNAVMRRAVECELPSFLARYRPGAVHTLASNSPGSFDARAHAVTDFVSDSIRYEFDGHDDVWQFPDETLAARVGDCEDRALLLASLLLASGISSFNVKVALGALRTERRSERPRDHGHAWVVYRCEAGRWLVLDPHVGAVAASKRSRKEPPRVSYRPSFLFNDVHVWAIHAAGAENEIVLKQGWGTVHPRFVGHVHRTILNRALEDVQPAPRLAEMNRHYTSILGRDAWTIDDADLPWRYDPVDHFDNGYIAQGWVRVRERLAAFRASGGSDTDSFVLAAHGIADFYAHSNYVHACDAAGRLPVPLYEGNPSNVGLDFDYSRAPFDIAHGEPSINRDVWPTPNLPAAADKYAGRPITGRYAQYGDFRSIIEAATPLPRRVSDERDFHWRATLPHHDEIAVDEPSGENAIYTKSEYARQFALRRNAAVRHVREAYIESMQGL